MKYIRCACGVDDCQRTLVFTDYTPSLFILKNNFPTEFFDFDEKGLLTLYEEVQRLVERKGLLNDDTPECQSTMSLAKALNRGRFYLEGTV